MPAMPDESRPFKSAMIRPSRHHAHPNSHQDVPIFINLHEYNIKMCSKSAQLRIGRIVMRCSLLRHFHGYFFFCL